MGLTHPDQLIAMQTQLAPAPDADLTVSPSSADDVATVLRFASEQKLTVQVFGGGTHSGYGSPPKPDIVLSMDRLAQVEVWEPDDLTMVLGAGAPVAAVESMLAEKNQTAVLPERPESATVGGSIAAGVSALRRGRLFGTRERLLEATVVTGDGRIVRSGGRVVKNVTGYDLHRLHVGAFGSLGVLVSLCLKLWPTPPAAATVRVDSIDQAKVAVRPLAILEENSGIRVFVWGTPDEVEAKASRLGGEVSDGHDWPADPSGLFHWSLRIPPALTGDALRRIPHDWRFLAVHGVGDVRLGSDEASAGAELRDWVETRGGHLVLSGSPSGFDELDPWGTPPSGLEIQRSLIRQFDPNRVINPGRLPGGL